MRVVRLLLAPLMCGALLFGSQQLLAQSDDVHEAVSVAERSKQLVEKQAALYKNVRESLEVFSSLKPAFGAFSQKRKRQLTNDMAREISSLLNEHRRELAACRAEIVDTEQAIGFELDSNMLAWIDEATQEVNEVFKKISQAFGRELREEGIEIEEEDRNIFVPVVATVGALGIAAGVILLVNWFTKDSGKGGDGQEGGAALRTRGNLGNPHNKSGASVFPPSANGPFCDLNDSDDGPLVFSHRSSDGEVDGNGFMGVELVGFGSDDEVATPVDGTGALQIKRVHFQTAEVVHGEGGDEESSDYPPPPDDPENEDAKGIDSDDPLGRMIDAIERDLEKSKQERLSAQEELSESERVAYEDKKNVAAVLAILSSSSSEEEGKIDGLMAQISDNCKSKGALQQFVAYTKSPARDTPGEEDDNSLAVLLAALDPVQEGLQTIAKAVFKK